MSGEPARSTYAGPELGYGENGRRGVTAMITCAFIGDRRIEVGQRYEEAED